MKNLDVDDIPLSAITSVSAEMSLDNLLPSKYVIEIADDSIKWPVSGVEDFVQDWMETDAGRWAIEHSIIKPVWYRRYDSGLPGYRYYVCVQFTPADLTYWKLTNE